MLMLLMLATVVVILWCLLTYWKTLSHRKDKNRFLLVAVGLAVLILWIANGSSDIGPRFVAAEAACFPVEDQLIQAVKAAGRGDGEAVAGLKARSGAILLPASTSVELLKEKGVAALVRVSTGYNIGAECWCQSRSLVVRP